VQAQTVEPTELTETVAEPPDETSEPMPAVEQVEIHKNEPIHNPAKTQPEEPEPAQDESTTGI
jgi:hypothetical protein